MCGRYALTHDARTLRDRFDARLVGEPPPRHNIAPGTHIPVVLESVMGTGEVRRRIEPMHWGLIPSWAKEQDVPSLGYRMINARSETASEKNAFQSALRRRRCLVPADGFYEWPKLAEESQPKPRRKGPKLPVWVEAVGEPVLGFAGLYEHWQHPGGSELVSVTILTGSAVEPLIKLHPRAPLVVPADRYDAWLDPLMDDGRAALTLLSDQPSWTLVPVSDYVNKAGNEGPRCREPRGEDAQDEPPGGAPLFA